MLDKRAGNALLECDSGALLRHVAGSVSAASVAVLVWGLLGPFFGWVWLLWLGWGRFPAAFFRVPWSSPPMSCVESVRVVGDACWCRPAFAGVFLNALRFPWYRHEGTSTTFLL